MKKILVFGTVALLLSACFGPGEMKKIAITMPDGQKATIVDHNQIPPDWMLARDKLAVSFIVRGDVSAKQLAAVAESERACRIHTEHVRPNDLVAVLSDGVLYAAAGFIGAGLGSMAFPGALFVKYAAFGASTMGTAGVANGTFELSGQTYTFENCAQTVMSLFPEYKVRIPQKSPW